MFSESVTVEPPPRVQATLFRFRLRSMLLYMGLLCVLFAAMAAVGGMLALALLLVAMIVAAHVLSTFVGTRLRDGATAEYSRVTPEVLSHEYAAAVSAGRAKVVAAEKERSRHLQGRGSLMPRLMWLVAGGSLVGTAVYTAIVVELLWPKVGIRAILAGGTAVGILSGWLVFLGFSFYVIARRAWREAVEPAPLTIQQRSESANTAPYRT